MIKLKLILFVFVFTVFSISSQGFAQDDTKKDETKKDETKQEVKTYKMTPEEQATKITDKLNKKLNLTPEQYTKIQKLFADNITYKRELRTKDIISKSEIKQKQKDFRDGIKNTLTEDQQKKMKKMMKKNFKRHHHKSHF
jgi:hypothetical protein